MQHHCMAKKKKITRRWIQTVSVTAVRESMCSLCMACNQYLSATMDHSMPRGPHFVYLGHGDHSMPRGPQIVSDCTSRSRGPLHAQKARQALSQAGSRPRRSHSCRAGKAEALLQAGSGSRNQRILTVCKRLNHHDHDTMPPRGFAGAAYQPSRRNSASECAKSCLIQEAAKPQEDSRQIASYALQEAAKPQEDSRQIVSSALQEAVKPQEDSRQIASYALQEAVKPLEDSRQIVSYALQEAVKPLEDSRQIVSYALQEAVKPQEDSRQIVSFALLKRPPSLRKTLVKSSHTLFKRPPSLRKTLVKSSHPLFKWPSSLHSIAHARCGHPAHSRPRAFETREARSSFSCAHSAPAREKPRNCRRWTAEGT
jgi:hypothetical protein